MKVIVNINNKEVNGFIIEEVNGYYKIGTYLGIIYRKIGDVIELF